MATKVKPQQAKTVSKKTQTVIAEKGTSLRPEVYIAYCTLLGMSALDISMEHQIFFAQDEAQLKAATHNAKHFFLHNIGYPEGALWNVVPLFILISVLALIYRLLKERKLLDLVQAVLLTAATFFFKTRVEPLEFALATIPDENVTALHLQLTKIFFGHVMLVVVLLVGIILQLFASPPSKTCRVELLAFWAGAGMTMIDSTFDLPVMLHEDHSMHGAFINNTCHIHTYVHEYLVPAIFAFIGLMLVYRIISHRLIKDILSFIFFVACLVCFVGFVEPQEKGMLAAGVPSRDSMMIIGAGHLSLTLCIVICTLLGLSAQSDVDKGSRKKKVE